VNWEAISAIGQLVGALAVVISLIYLASEVRGSARATRIASERSLVEMFIQFPQQLTESHLSELYYRGIQDFESLKGAEIVRFSALMDQMFKLPRSKCRPMILISLASGSAIFYAMFTKYDRAKINAASI
jgi:hypothetical protein